jgi:hypothetical protein
MNVYELVNPSDEWTFLAPNDKIAWLVSFIVGEGKTPAKRDGWSSGLYIFGGDPEKDFEKEFGEPLKGFLDRYRDDIIKSLRTFMIHRERSEKPLEGKELREWNENLRSSINDFGGYAFEFADRLERKNLPASG